MTLNFYFCVFQSEQRPGFRVMLKHFETRKAIVCFFIAGIAVTSPIVINMPTRELLAGETKSSFV